MGKNQDPGSGINIPDPQHWLMVISNFSEIWFDINFCFLSARAERRTSSGWPRSACCSRRRRCWSRHQHPRPPPPRRPPRPRPAAAAAAAFCEFTLLNYVNSQHSTEQISRNSWLPLWLTSKNSLFIYLFIVDSWHIFIDIFSIFYFLHDTIFTIALILTFLQFFIVLHDAIFNSLDQ